MYNQHIFTSDILKQEFIPTWFLCWQLENWKNKDSFGVFHVVRLMMYSPCLVFSAALRSSLCRHVNARVCANVHQIASMLWEGLTPQSACVRTDLGNSVPTELQSQTELCAASRGCLACSADDQ